MAKKEPKLTVLNCGRLTTSGGRYLDAAGITSQRDDQSALSCYLIDHPKGRVLVDTGIPDEWAEFPAGVARGGGKFMFESTDPLLPQLSRLGLAPEDIQFVVYTHLHNDHTGNLAKFPGARPVLQRSEYDFAFGPRAEEWGYEPESYRPLVDLETLLVDGEHDLFGDGAVRLFPTPGHTPGHQVVLVNLKKNGRLLICGDLYYTAEDRQPRRFPKWNFNWPKTLESMERVEQLAAEEPTRLLMGHDWAEWEAWSATAMPLN